MEKYIAKRKFKIGCGTHTQNPNPKYYITISDGDEVWHEGDADNGDVWFYSEIPSNIFDYSKRGKIGCGCIENMIRNGYVIKA